MGEHLHVRVLDLTTGSTLVEHKIDEANTAIMGDRDGEIALHALDRGHTVALEVMPSFRFLSVWSSEIVA